MKKLLSIAFALLAFGAMKAQKILQIETVNRARTVKMFCGERLIYKLQGAEEWEKAEITDLDVDKQVVVLGLMRVPVSDIVLIKRPKRRFLQAIGAQLAVFGIAWAGYSAIGDFWYKDEINWKTAAWISGASIPLGWYLMQPRKLKMGERHRLRALDISYLGTQPQGH